MNQQLLTKWNNELEKLAQKKTLNKIDKQRKKELEEKLQSASAETKASGVFSNKQVIGFEVDKVILNPKQPRKLFDEKSISELAESIKVYGQLEPVVIADIAGKHYLVSGERRFRAVKYLGLKRIDGVINDSIRTQDDLYFYAIAENADRKDLNCGELAVIVKTLKEEYNLTYEKISQLLNMSITALHRHYKISSLPTPLLDKVILNDINKPNILEKIVELKDEKKQEYYIDTLINSDLSIADIRDVVVKPIKNTKPVREVAYKTLNEGISYFKNKLELIENSSEKMNKRDFNKLINEFIEEIKNLKKLK
jgi:ParB family chromosome partitioning protein